MKTIELFALMVIVLMFMTCISSGQYIKQLEIENQFLKSVTNSSMVMFDFRVHCYDDPIDNITKCTQDCHGLGWACDKVGELQDLQQLLINKNIDELGFKERTSDVT